MPIVRQRLHADAIAHTVQLLVLLIIKNKCKHADKAIHGCNTPLFKRMKHHLRVGMRIKLMLFVYKFVANLIVIVDFAVENNRKIFIKYGLTGGRTKIDDG